MDNIDRHSVVSLATPDAAPACLARRHSRWLRFCLDRRYSSTSLPPLAPSPLRDFTATMEALTPIRPALRSLHEHRLFGEQVSLIHVSDLPTPPSPTTPQALDVDFARYPLSRRVSCLRRSRLHLFPAGSPTLTGRIEFVILRMDRSPPAAPHLASRRRSCSRLQAGERIPEEDSHLSDQTRFQAHWNARSCARFSDNTRLRIESELAQCKRAQERPLHLKPFCRDIRFSREVFEWSSMTSFPQRLHHELPTWVDPEGAVFHIRIRVGTGHP